MYNNEHLIYGQIGHFLTVLNLVASLAACIAFFNANKIQNEIQKNSWLKIAKAFFAAQTISVFIIFGLLLFLVANHLHEYYFAWNHSSRTLQAEYLLSCLWEDQSGSFLLWAIWNSVLGWVFMQKQKHYAPAVLTVISFAQFCIATMVIGVYIFGQKIGNNPFALLRNQLDAPMLFQNPDYLNFPKIYEGNDLNALLQNYWMVIHPPVLFLGFSSTIIPFAFAYAGLVNKDHNWTKPALSWAGFSAAVLGLGIMMGAAWAYESLSFGGYWAWDPVENASLVPWITLVAGLHCNLIYKSSGYSLKSAYFFYIVSFVLILYSTFLTRSGILGDTSVHAFTGADMTAQLFLYVNLFVWFIPILTTSIKKNKFIYTGLLVATSAISIYWPVAALISVLAGFVAVGLSLNEQHFPSTKNKEEETYSREFWMFVGSLVLFLSAAIITIKTSVPVFNKLFGTKIAPPEDPEFAHNQVQVFVALIIGILTAITQFLKYKNTDKKTFYKNISIPTLIALVISGCISVFGNINYDKFGYGFLAAIHLAIFGSVYAVIANAYYIVDNLKGKIKNAGASIAHIGFGLVLVGILISSSKKAVLSWNTTGIAIFKKSKQEDPAENITLFKGVRTDMKTHHVTYELDSFNAKDKKKYFKLLFEDKATNEKFYLYPDALKANKGQEGYSFNPDKKHYWHKDIFVYITSFIENKIADTIAYKNTNIKLGDTVFYGNGRMVLEAVNKDAALLKKKLPTAEAGMFLQIKVINKENKLYTINPGVGITKQGVESLPDTLLSQAMTIKFNKIVDEASSTFEIGVKESEPLPELITLKVYNFPMINVLWIGIIIMVFGFLMSAWKRGFSQK